MSMQHKPDVVIPHSVKDWSYLMGKIASEGESPREEKWRETFLAPFNGSDFDLYSVGLESEYLAREIGEGITHFELSGDDADFDGFNQSRRRA
jgi:hypothetical protein